MAHEYGFSVEETEYIAKAASSLYKLTRIHLVKKERFDEFMKHIYKVPGTNKQIIKKFARIGEASIIYSIGRHRFIELARAAGATYKINEGTGGTVLVNLEIFDNYMEQFRQPVRPLKEPLYGQEEGELNEYWHICLMSTLFPGKESVRILCFPIHMTALEQLRLQLHPFVLFVTIH